MIKESLTEIKGTYLGSDGMGSGGEELGDASSLETSFGETEGGSETGTTSTNNDGIVLMVNNGVVTDTALAL